MKQKQMYIKLLAASLMLVFGTATHVSPPTGPPAVTGVDCLQGAYYPGPTCDTFYICVTGVWGRQRLTLFHCGPGTVFDRSLSVCVHMHQDLCPAAAPITPRPIIPPPPPPLAPPIPGAVPPGGLVPSVVIPSPPGMTFPLVPSPWPPKKPIFPTSIPFVGPPATTSRPIISLPFTELNESVSQSTPSCPKYKLDPTSILDCTHEGRWEHPGDCQRFYQCIHTMDCILKGFLFRCPRDYHYITSKQKCQELDRIVPCHKFSDAIADLGAFVYPVVQLEKESMSQFDQASAYWDYMPFLPHENQRIILPPSYLLKKNGK